MRKKVIFGAQKCLPCVDQVWFESVHISLSRTQNTKTETPVEINAAYDLTGLPTKHDEQSL